MTAKLLAGEPQMTKMNSFEGDVPQRHRIVSKSPVIMKANAIA